MLDPPKRNPRASEAYDYALPHLTIWELSGGYSFCSIVPDNITITYSFWKSQAFSYISYDFYFLFGSPRFSNIRALNFYRQGNSKPIIHLPDLMTHDMGTCFKNMIFLFWT